MRVSALPVVALLSFFAVGPIEDAGAQNKGCVSTTAATVSYAAQVQPLFDTYCVVCHQDALSSGGLNLQDGTAPGSLINVLNTTEKMVRVAPGDPAASYIYRKLTGTHLEIGGAGEKMPLGGSLSESEIALIETWIRECPNLG